MGSPIREGISNVHPVAKRLHRWGVIALLACMTGGFAAAAVAQMQGRTVGTLQRHDPKQHRIVLSTDAATGSELGQGAPVNLYYDEAAAARTRSTRPKLQPGDRLLLETVANGNRIEAVSVHKLADTTPGQDWGRYLHGTIGDLVPRNSVLMVDQDGSRIRNRMKHDAQTTVYALDGSPMRIDQLKVGDEVDMAYRVSNKDGIATKIVLLRPSAVR